MGKRKNKKDMSEFERWLVGHLERRLEIRTKKQLEVRLKSYLR